MARYACRALLIGIASTALHTPYASAEMNAVPNTTTARAMLVPVQNGVQIRSLLTAGQSPPNQTEYRLSGVADGLGLLDNDDGSFDLLMNHEIRASKGIKRAHGAPGAFISRWRIEKKSGTIVRGEDQIKQVLLFDNDTQRYNSTIYTFASFCSADLPAPTALNTHKDKVMFGISERIFFNGEEIHPRYSDRYGRAFAHIVTGKENGRSYELPRFGKMAIENVLLNPTPQLATIAVITDDATNHANFETTSDLHKNAPSELYLYVGLKQQNGSLIERAGLTNGSLFGLKVHDRLVENVEFGFGDDKYRATEKFSFHEFGDVSHDQDGRWLQEQSVRNHVTQFRRIEDGVWDIRNPSRFYFITTDEIDGYPRVFRLSFDDITQPQLGGSIEIVINGRDHGMNMLDNVTIDPWGRLILLEDPGKNVHLASMWLYDPLSDKILKIATVDRLFFDKQSNNEKQFLTIDEEITGIIPAFDLLGDGWYLTNVQAHRQTDATDVVEHGQLLAIYIPPSDQFAVKTK